MHLLYTFPLHYWFSREHWLVINSWNEKMEATKQVPNFMLCVGKNKIASSKIVKNMLILKNRPIYAMIKLMDSPVLTWSVAWISTILSEAIIDFSLWATCRAHSYLSLHFQALTFHFSQSFSSHYLFCLGCFLNSCLFHRLNWLTGESNPLFLTKLCSNLTLAKLTSLVQHMIFEEQHLVRLLLLSDPQPTMSIYLD